MELAAYSDQETLPAEYQDAVFRVVTSLSAAINNTRLYSFDHPQVSRYLGEAYERLTGILRVKPEMTLLLIGDDLVIDNQSLKTKGPQIAQFARVLRNNAIERITFIGGMPRQDLYDLIRDIASATAASVCSSTFIKLGKVEMKGGLNTSEGKSSGLVKPGPGGSDADSSSLLVRPGGADPLPAEVQEAGELLDSLKDDRLESMKALYSSMKRNKKIDVRSVDGVIKAFVKGLTHSMNPVGLLASLKTADEYTFTHVVNVCILTMSQAESLGFTGRHLYQVGIASILHDVGKLFIPEEIINKPGALTTEERAEVETHTLKGARYIIGLDRVPKLAVLGALEHHIKYDGTGYPSITGNWQPNVVSQLIAISDVFDAMRSRRPYQDPKPEEVIVKILREEKGTAFNPFLVDNFLKLIKR